MNFLEKLKERYDLDLYLSFWDGYTTTIYYKGVLIAKVKHLEDLQETAKLTIETAFEAMKGEYSDIPSELSHLIFNSIQEQLLESEVQEVNNENAHSIY